MQVNQDTVLRFLLPSGAYCCLCLLGDVVLRWAGVLMGRLRLLAGRAEGDGGWCFWWGLWGVRRFQQGQPPLNPPESVC